jgi:hypothetical protein
MAAKDDYFRLDAQMGGLCDRLSECHDPAARADLLAEAGDTEQQMADMRLEVFGPDPIEWENGRDLSESLAHSTLLLRLLADVERATDTTLRRRLTASWLEPYAGPVLDRMACTTQIEHRAQMLRELYESVEPHVGGQAAETLACVPYAPGQRGWSDERYLPNSFPKLVRTLWRAWRAA